MRENLARLQQIDRSLLDNEHLITYDVLETSLEMTIEESRFPWHLLPVDQFNNFASGFVSLGSGSGIHPFDTVDDYQDFLGRVDGFVRGVDEAIRNMREGADRGVVQPRIVVERVLPQLAAHIVDDAEASAFWTPIEQLPEGFSENERRRLTREYRSAIFDRIVPAFARLHDYMRDEYLPRSRATIGLSSLPDGRAWYEFEVHRRTTTDMSPEDIHALGLAEVDRIHAEMTRVKNEVGFAGTLGEFFQHLRHPRYNYTTREEMLEDYRSAKARIDASTDRLFDVRPSADYEIRPVEAFREQSAAAGSYRSASPDGTRPGVFYVNTYEPQTRSRHVMENLLLHEGSPGHHFQISIQRELDHLPAVRRFYGFTAFSEGWGLYAETLGRELGVYTDPYQYFGALNGELWRAIRLVLDTGIHAMGWTREEAIDFARENSSQNDPYIVAEVERFIAYPGQALAYKIGQLKFTELRGRASTALGPRFDIRAFHNEMLRDGQMPLRALEAKTERWIERQR